MAIEFWLSYNNGAEKLRLPVNPESLSVSSPFSHTDVQVAKLGEVSVFGERGLKEFSFSTFFPEYYNETYCEYSKFPKPSACVATLEKWRDKRKPIRFIVTGTKVNIPVTIRDFSYEIERSGHGADIPFSLSLKEYRFLDVRKEVTKKKDKQRPPVVNPDKPNNGGSSYVVKKNDTLSKIAKSVYNDASKWRKIYDANKKLIGSNPNIIKVGAKLVIPK